MESQEYNEQGRLKPHCGLVTPYGEIWVNIGSGNGLLPGRHQAITWTNVDFSSVKSSDNHTRWQFHKRYLARRNNLPRRKNYAHILYFVVFWCGLVSVNLVLYFTHILQGCFIGNWAIMRLSRCPWAALKNMGKDNTNPH